METRRHAIHGSGAPGLLLAALLSTAGDSAALSRPSATQPIPGLFNSGVDDAGNALPNGQLDPHWQVTYCLDTCAPNNASPVAPCQTSPTSIAAFASALAAGAWVIPPAGSKWIRPNNGGPNGTYVFAMEFDLTGLDPSTAVVTGSFASDNQSKIVLNGIDTGDSVPGNGFSSLHPFTLQNGFVHGVNQLEFHLCEWGAVEGLLVADLTGSAVACSGMHYGAPTAGSGGIAPTIALSACPILGSTIEVEIADGLGEACGCLAVGPSQVSLPAFGGTVLVGQPWIPFSHVLTGPPGVPGIGTHSESFEIPNDPALVGLTFYFQAGYLDPGAPAGVSMTDGVAVTV